MPRLPDPIWKEFGKATFSDGGKVPRAECKHCGKSVTATATNAKCHFANCKNTPRSVGLLPPTNNEPSTSSRPVESHRPSTSSSISTSTAIAVCTRTDSTSVLQKQKIDRLVASAIHRTCSPFNLLDHPSWQAVFAELRPSYKPPPPTRISTTLLDDEYKRVMEETRQQIIASGGGVLGIDGATNVLSKSSSNVIVQNHWPWFVEYLKSCLKKETAEEVADQIEDVLRRLRVEWIADESCTFPGFMSDSCNTMRALRRVLLRRKAFLFAIGCATHCINNLIEDILKMPRFKSIVKKVL